MSCREAFEKWLNSTIDCKHEYDPVCGYLPQEIYQLYQAWSTAWNTRTSCTPMPAVDDAELEQILKDAHVMHYKRAIQALRSYLHPINAAVDDAVREIDFQCVGIYDERQSFRWGVVFKSAEDREKFIAAAQKQDADKDFIAQQQEIVDLIGGEVLAGLMSGELIAVKAQKQGRE